MTLTGQSDFKRNYFTPLGKKFAIRKRNKKNTEKWMTDPTPLKSLYSVETGDFLKPTALTH